MASFPNQSWTQAMGNVAGQGKPLEEQLSSSNRYYAFLAKVELDTSLVPGLYHLLFEVVNMEWMNNAVFNRPVTIETLMPRSPALVYYVPGVDEKTALAELNLKTIGELAEGSWYLLTLERATLTEDDSTISGELYDPDIDWRQ